MAKATKPAVPPPQDSGESDPETCTSNHTEGSRSDEDKRACKLNLGSDAPSEQNQADIESSDDEPVPPPESKRQRNKSIVKSPEQEAIDKSPEQEATTDDFLALMHSHIEVSWSSVCEEKDKEDLLDIIVEEMSILLQTCECFGQLRMKLDHAERTRNYRSKRYEASYNTRGWAVYMRRYLSSSSFDVGDLLFRISLKR